MTCDRDSQARCQCFESCCQSFQACRRCSQTWCQCSHVPLTITLALRGVLKLIIITPMVHLNLSSEIPVMLKAGRNALLGSDISKMYFSHWEPPAVCERRRSVDLQALISGGNPTLSRDYGRASHALEFLMTGMGAP
jgi:hypothetical protein